MTFGSSFCKKGHCIHILWCIFMGLIHNDPWVESHMWSQQPWGQRSSRGQRPFSHLNRYGVKSNNTMHKYVIAKASETRGSRTALSILHLNSCSFIRKCDSIDAFFSDINYIFCVIAMSETLFNEDHFNLVDIPNYSLIISNLVQTGERSGGCALYRTFATFFTQSNFHVCLFLIFFILAVHWGIRKRNA